MAPDASFYAAGHSVGGVPIQEELMADNSLADGLVLWASYLLGDYQIMPGPIMTMNGDMDGQNRITTIYVLNRKLIEDMDSLDPSLKYSFPVHIMEGVNHGQFATGTMPPQVVRDDIESDIPDVQARNMIANATAVFIDYYSKLEGDPGTVAEAIMDEWYDHTVLLGEPIYTAFDIEEDSMSKSSAWSEEAQRLLSGLTDTELQTIQVEDQTVPSNLISQARANITKSDDGNITITTSTSVFQERIPDYESAEMLEVKMVSSQKIKETLYESIQPADRPINCTDVNMESWNLARSLLSQRRLDLFDNNNVVVTFVDDDQVFWGPGWVTADLVFDFDRATMELLIQSTTLWGQVINGIGGYHYCKLLSPARAFEFMYIDGLREQL